MRRYSYLVILLILLPYVPMVMLVDSDENGSYGIALSISDGIILPRGYSLIHSY